MREDSRDREDGDVPDMEKEPEAFAAWMAEAPTSDTDLEVACYAPELDEPIPYFLVVR